DAEGDTGLPADAVALTAIMPPNRARRAAALIAFGARVSAFIFASYIELSPFSANVSLGNLFAFLLSYPRRRPRCELSHWRKDSSSAISRHSPLSPILIGTFRSAGRYAKSLNRPRARG